MVGVSVECYTGLNTTSIGSIVGGSDNSDKVGLAGPLGHAGGSDDSRVDDSLPCSVERSNSPSLRVPDFDEVYESWFEEVSRWIRALGAPKPDCDDIVQDVFVTVYRRLGSFDGRNLPGWLYQITRRKVRDFRRLRWVRLFQRKVALPEELASAAHSPEGDFISRQGEATLTRLLDKLPEAQRSAFVLFEVEGYGGEEIARLQGVPINTVWARIRKARIRLMKHVERLPQYRDRRPGS